MRRCLLACAVICLSLSSFAQYQSNILEGLGKSEVENSMREQVQFLSSAMLEGRKAGSQGEKEAAQFIYKSLSEYGLEMLGSEDGEIFGIKQDDGSTLTSRNVIGFIPGYDKELREHYIVISARLDNLGTRKMMVDGEPREQIFYGANGNASGLAMLMQLANKLNTNKVLFKRSVIIAAFGSSLELGAGAWYFLNRSFKGVENIDAMINLDMLGTMSNGFYAYTASNNDLNAIVSKLAGTLQPVQPKLVSMEPVSSDHRIFYDKQIPSIFFTTGMYPEYNSTKDTASILEYDNMERELEYIYNYSVELINGRKPEFRTSDESGQKYNDNKDVYSYSDCQTKPIFLGSSDPSSFLKNWVYVYLRYPKVAVEAGTQGRVLVNFVIDEKGKVGDVRVVKGVSEALDEEAIRVVSASPNWKPAKRLGKKVKCEMSVYIEFKLKRNK